MNNKKVVIAGGGVLGTQIGLICAYHGFDTTFWLRSESSIGRTTPKIERYSALMIEDLLKAKALVGNPMGAFMYPKGMIADWQGMTAEKIDALAEEGARRMKENIHIELDMAKAVKGAYIVIESMSEDPQAKIGVYTAMKDLLDEDTILCTNSSTLLPSMFAEYTGRPEKYCSLHFANTIWKNNTAEIMGTGAPAGPFQILDIVGLETAYNINQMKPAAQQEGTVENKIGKLLKEKIDRGEKGVNFGKGFYEYK